MTDKTPSIEEFAAQVAEIGKALEPLRESFQAIAEAITTAINQPGVREALANGARRQAAQCREEAALKRLAANPEAGDGFLKLLLKTSNAQQAVRLEERAVELDDAADYFEGSKAA